MTRTTVKKKSMKKARCLPECQDNDNENDDDHDKNINQKKDQTETKINERARDRVRVGRGRGTIICLVMCHVNGMKRATNMSYYHSELPTNGDSASLSNVYDIFCIRTL